MSYNQNIAAMSVDLGNGSAFQFQFASAATPEGMIPNMNEAVEEVLQTPGVDGQRWRTVHYQYMPFQMTTLADVTDDQSAMLLVLQYKKSKGKFATLGYYYRSQFSRWQNVHIVDAKHRILPGPMYGFGSTSGSTQVVQCMWTLNLTAGAV